MKVTIITQARMTSTRLPGKVLKTVLGKPLLAYQIERLRRVPNADEVMVATTTNPEDDPIIELCASLGVPVHRGSEMDVLERYHGAAKASGADVVVRVTSDCPLIDPEVSALVIERFLSARGALDYVSNTQQRTYPRGLDTEIFPFALLELASKEAVIPYEREHVTPFFYTRPERFRIGQVVDAQDNNTQRWTVDTPEDFELIRLLLERLLPTKPDFAMRDVLDVLRQNPEWVQINAHIEQKKLGE